MHYEKIGKVDDMFVDENNEPGYIGIKVGSLGTKTALIPIQALRVNDRQQHVEVSATREEIEEGPAFGDDGELTSKFQRWVLGHYSVLGRRDFGQRGDHGASYPASAGDGRVDLRPGGRAEAQRAGAGEQRSRERYTGKERPRERRPREERPAERRPAGAARGEVGRERVSGGELKIERVEEELRAGTREREVGTMNVRKRVRTER